jgi:hypothetical protein
MRFPNFLKRNPRTAESQASGIEIVIAGDVSPLGAHFFGCIVGRLVGDAVKPTENEAVFVCSDEVLQAAPADPECRSAFLLGIAAVNGHGPMAGAGEHHV